MSVSKGRLKTNSLPHWNVELAKGLQGFYNFFFELYNKIANNLFISLLLFININKRIVIMQYLNQITYKYSN